MSQPTGFYNLSEEILTLVVCGLGSDVESLKSARLVHPRLAFLKYINQQLFGTLRLFPDPICQRTMHPAFLTTAPYVKELVLLPAVPKDQCARSIRYGKAVHLMCAAKGEAITQPAKDSAKRFLSILQQLKNIRTITFGKVNCSDGHWPEWHDYQTVVIFYLWCLGRAKIKPHTINFEAAPVRAFIDRIWLADHGGEAAHARFSERDEQWQTAWRQLDVSQLKEVYMDVAHDSLYQSTQGLVELLDEVCRPQLERLAIKRLNRFDDHESFMTGVSGWEESALRPCTGQTTLRHLNIDGGVILLRHIIPWIKANPNLAELSLARVRSVDIDGDFPDYVYSTDLQEWHSLFTTIRNHPSRMLVRLTKLDGPITASQPHDVDVSLIHHTSNCAPEHSDRSCKMVMEYMSGIGSWNDKRDSRF